MYIFILAFIALTVLIIAIVNRKNKEKFNKIIKNNIIKIIIIYCMIPLAILICYSFVNIFSKNYDITNFTTIILYVLSIIILIFNKKLSKNNILIVSTIIIYILIIIIMPVFFIEDHTHNIIETPENIPEGMDEDDMFYNFYAYWDMIVEYKNYYNMFGFNLFTIEEN